MSKKCRMCNKPIKFGSYCDEVCAHLFKQAQNFVYVQKLGITELFDN